MTLWIWSKIGYDMQQGIVSLLDNEYLTYISLINRTNHFFLMMLKISSPLAIIFFSSLSNPVFFSIASIRLYFLFWCINSVSLFCFGFYEISVSVEVLNYPSSSVFQKIFWSQIIHPYVSVWGGLACYF